MCDYKNIQVINLQKKNFFEYGFYSVHPLILKSVCFNILQYSEEWRFHTFLIKSLLLLLISGSYSSYNIHRCVPIAQSNPTCINFHNIQDVIILCGKKKEIINNLEQLLSEIANPHFYFIVEIEFLQVVSRNRQLYRSLLLNLSEISFHCQINYAQKF